VSLTGPTFILKDLEDPYARENFKRLLDYLDKFPFFRGEWAFFTFTLPNAVTNLNLAHGLGFKPLDVIQTSITGAGTITFNYSRFTDETISVTTSGACSVRCFIGAYKEESSRAGR
jgi:hypothetical protein